MPFALWINRAEGKKHLRKREEMGITSPSVFIRSLLLLFSLLQRPTFASKKSYVVYFGGHSHGLEVSTVDYERVTDSHYEFLGSFLGSKEKAKDAIFYSYTKHINGFAANLDEEEAMEIAKRPEVISLFINKGRELHTTRSWQFLGLEKDGVVPSHSIWKQARFGEDTIIGNLDSGVWPESESFNDDGMGPIPSKWKGMCHQDQANCNRKLIGMRYFNYGFQAAVGPLNSSFDTARDTDGHGTHTLSTAGGGFVSGANLFGYANGTAKGGSPNARVAAYKVCWLSIKGKGCYEADIIAAFDAAISDGVDVLSVSIGGVTADNYFEDGVAIGSFHAVRKGIVVVASAGNYGPTAGTVTNVAPWILTVGASTMDRKFSSEIKLGNNKVYKGQSLSSKYLPEKLYPLIKFEDAKAANATIDDTIFCQAGSLDPKKVKGKIVFCLRGFNARVQKGEVVGDAGGIAMILVGGNEPMVDPHVLPATQISELDGLDVFLYMNSTKSPVAYITRPMTNLGTKPAPLMAEFSSQGPSIVNPEILKPDITAPGVSILAAYSLATSPSGLAMDTRRVPYNILSGTSMSCPHVSGIVGLLKTLHPDWSPSAIRSAIMTTSRSRDNLRQPMKNSSFIKATPYSYGAGHVRPNRAMDPGLVYDTTVDDYLNFLCALGYNSTQIATFADKTYSCPSKTLSLTSLNYPSISVPYLTESTTVTRTVKNVGSPGMYKVRIRAPKDVLVSVQPKSLRFSKIGEEKTFMVKLRPKKGGLIDEYSFGRLIWSDGVHYVRSPIVVS
ncbi:subtilisin-like protease SBT5.3 [Tasmannia lanceolata]|uniref:subtilisin-like protease SBT5.3 n=1 Tax=Tasmannia lanceolata TaxID=3420 RepID=UPI004064BB61